jgi:hypothetical protein
MEVLIRRLCSHDRCFCSAHGEEDCLLLGTSTVLVTPTPDADPQERTRLIEVLIRTPRSAHGEEDCTCTLFLHLLIHHGLDHSPHGPQFDSTIHRRRYHR